MSNLTISFTAIVFASAVAIAAPAQPISRQGMMEIALHRVEKLIDSKKIDPNFRDRFEHIFLRIDESKPPVYFVINAFQTAPSGNGKPLEAVLQHDQKGKPLSYKETADGTAGPNFDWKPKDPLTLAEVAVHHIDHYSSDVKMKPFFEGLESLTIVKGTLNNEVVAQIEGTRINSTDKLYMYLRLNDDATLINWEVVAR